MNIEVLCISDLKSAKAVINLHKSRDPNLKQLCVPKHIKQLLAQEVRAGHGTIRTDYFERQYRPHAPSREALIVGGIEILESWLV